MKSLFIGAVSVAALTAGQAMAGTITYNDFSSTDGLALAGDAVSSSGALVLTPSTGTQTFQAGTALTSNALALGPSASFNTTFQFQINTAADVMSGNGFAFVLTTNPTNVGTGNPQLGLTNATSTAIEFSDYGNPNLNPSISGGLYNSNLVAAISNGNTDVQNNAAGSYGSPGPAECDLKGSPVNRSKSGCMNNGDVWTVDINYANGLLNVALKDGANGSFVSVISNYAIAIAGNVYAGFSGSTGAAYQSVKLLDWSMNYSAVPEPGSVGLVAAGLAALAITRRRRSV